MTILYIPDLPSLMQKSKQNVSIVSKYSFRNSSQAHTILRDLDMILFLSKGRTYSIFFWFCGYHPSQAHVTLRGFKMTCHHGVNVFEARYPLDLFLPRVSRKVYIWWYLQVCICSISFRLCGYHQIYTILRIANKMAREHRVKIKIK